MSARVHTNRRAQAHNNMSLSVRRAEPADIRQVVRVHQGAFPGFLLTDLGPRFLTMLYSAFVGQDDGILLLAESSRDGVVGLLAGTRAPPHFFRALRARRGIAMALASIPGLARHPIRIGARLLAAIRYGGDQPPTLPGYWLLSSLGVQPEHASSGIGTILVNRFYNMAREARAPGIYLLTDVKDNEAVLNFYAKRQFVVHSRNRRRDGRELLVLAQRFD
jgi:ribosomal protein S18 acetylase RimI-like enzyme